MSAPGNPVPRSAARFSVGVITSSIPSPPSVASPDIGRRHLAECYRAAPALGSFFSSTAPTVGGRAGGVTLGTPLVAADAAARHFITLESRNPDGDQARQRNGHRGRVVVGLHTEQSAWSAVLCPNQSVSESDQ